MNMNIYGYMYIYLNLYDIKKYKYMHKKYVDIGTYENLYV